MRHLPLHDCKKVSHQAVGGRELLHRLQQRVVTSDGNSISVEKVDFRTSLPTERRLGEGELLHCLRQRAAGPAAQTLVLLDDICTFNDSRDGSLPRGGVAEGNSCIASSSVRPGPTAHAWNSALPSGEASRRSRTAWFGSVANAASASRAPRCTGASTSACFASALRSEMGPTETEIGFKTAKV